MKMSSITVESIVSQMDDIVESDIDDEKVMMSVEKGQYYGFDAVASRIWELIAQPVKVAFVIDQLLLKYDVDRKTCETEVLEFLEGLHADGILKVEA